MKVKLVSIFMFVWLFCIKVVVAQIVDESKFTKELNIKDNYDTKSIQNKVFIFSISVAVNKFGKVDSVYFSNIDKPLHLDDVVNKKRIKNYLKNEIGLFKKYVNTIVIIPVMIRNLDDLSVSYLKELEEDWCNLFPNLSIYRNRKIVLNKPVCISFIIDYD